MSKKEPHIVLCMPVAECPYPVAGSRMIDCSVCNARIWLSRVTEAKAIERGLPVYMCTECTISELKNHKNVEAYPITDAQIAEVLDHKRRRGGQ